MSKPSASKPSKSEDELLPSVSKEESGDQLPKKKSTAVAKKTKAKAPVPETSDHEEDDDGDDEEDKTAPKVPDVSEAEMANRIAKMTRLLDYQRSKLAIEYTPDKRKVHEVPATAFAKQGIQASTPCVVCHVRLSPSSVMYRVNTMLVIRLLSWERAVSVISSSTRE